MAGAKGKSGRRPDSTTLHFRELVDNIWTREKREACLNTLIADCESSEFQVRNESRKLLFAYTFGKPAEQMKHTGEDGGPIVVKVIYEKPERCQRLKEK